MADVSKTYNTGLIIGGLIGATAVATMAISTPFILPALRRHCLPYVPATDSQLHNLSKALKRHSKKGDRFLDIGSGDGRICRMAASLDTYSQIHGVELNSVLVLYSKFKNISFKSTQAPIRYHRRDLWKFPLSQYDSVCIFGVESMIESLSEYIQKSNSKPKKIFACRFPFRDLDLVEQIGEGIDTVWIYKLEPKYKTNIER